MEKKTTGREFLFFLKEHFQILCERIYIFAYEMLHALGLLFIEYKKWYQKLMIVKKNYSLLNVWQAFVLAILA